MSHHSFKISNFIKNKKISKCLKSETFQKSQKIGFAFSTIRYLLYIYLNTSLMQYIIINIECNGLYFADPVHFADSVH